MPPLKKELQYSNFKPSIVVTMVLPSQEHKNKNFNLAWLNGGKSTLLCRLWFIRDCRLILLTYLLGRVSLLADVRHIALSLIKVECDHGHLWYNIDFFLSWNKLVTCITIYASTLLPTYASTLLPVSYQWHMTHICVPYTHQLFHCLQSNATDRVKHSLNINSIQNFWSFLPCVW